MVAVVAGMLLLTAAPPVRAQSFGVTRWLQFQYVPRWQSNPYMLTNPQRYVLSNLTASYIGPYGDAVLYRHAGYNMPAALRYNSHEPGQVLGSGFGSNSKVAAEQRSAIAEAQRNAKWDQGATEQFPGFDQWMKDAGARREGTAPEKGAKELPVDPALVNPPDEAILSGDALNRLAVRIRELEKLGKKGTPGLLAPELTTKIVFVGAAADAANLFRGTELKYPASIQTAQFEPLRKELDKAFGPVAKDAHAGKKANPADVDRLLKAIAKARETSRQTVADAAFTDACDVCDFFTKLESATKVLKDEKTAGVAGKEWSVAGVTVAELVQHLGKYGLRFGPVKSGEEAAYFSLHRGLLAYCFALSQAK